VFATIGSEYLYISLTSIIVRFTYFLQFVNATSMHSVHKRLSAALKDVNMRVNLGLQCLDCQSSGIPKQVAAFIKLDSFPSSNERVLRCLFRFVQQKELLSDAENVVRTS